MPASSLEDRLWPKIDAAGDCWEWTANAGRYGRFTAVIDGRRRNLLAHRVVWSVLVGPIPDGLEIDHRCRNTLCVNPDHLQPVTTRVNVRRSFNPMALNARKLVCVNGHDLTDPANLFPVERVGQRRVCRTCATDNQRQALPRRRAAYVGERREMIQQKAVDHYWANQDQAVAKARAYRVANREEINARRRAARVANREEINAARRATQDANREEINAARRAARDANREEINARDRAYRAANRERINARDRAYRAARRAAGASA